MPRKKKRIPLSREEALRAEDEFMLNYGHLSLWYDGWYNSRGKAIIDAREKALAEWEAQLPTVRFASKEVAAPVSFDSEMKGARGDKPQRPHGLKAIGVVGFAAMRKRVAKKFAKTRAIWAKAKARAGNKALTGSKPCR
jgi:hypothetical protein